MLGGECRKPLDRGDARLRQDRRVLGIEGSELATDLPVGGMKKTGHVGPWDGRARKRLQQAYVNRS